MIMMRHLDYRLQLTTTSTTPSRTTTPTSTSVTTSNVTETTPRDSTSWFCPTVAVKWWPTTLMVTPDTLLKWNTKVMPTTSTNQLTNPLTNPFISQPTNLNINPHTNLNTRVWAGKYIYSVCDQYKWFECNKQINLNLWQTCIPTWTQTCLRTSS